MKTDGAFCRFVGPLQKQVYLILTLPIFFTAFTFFVDVFTSHITPCSENIAKSLNHRVDINISNITASRTENHSDLASDGTCHEANHFSHGKATYMTGLLIGSVVGGAVSDRYGKKLLLICCSAVHAVATLIVAFLPYEPVYLTVRGISGAACCAIHICTYSLESPQWLLLNKRMKTLEGYQNRSPEDKHYLDLLLESVDSKMQKSLTEKTSSKTESNFANFTSHTILLRLFIMSYIGFASALTYYGICFSVGSFGVNIYLAQFFSGLSETPSLLLPFLLKRWGRRPFSMASLFLSGISCMLSLLVSKFCDMPALVMTLALMGKLCMQSTTCVSLLYGIELFPTVIRQKCVGLVSLCYRVACIINAVVTPEGGIPLPAMICYSSGPIIGAALCLFLPETSGIPLPDTVQDCEKQPRLKLSCSARLPVKHTQESDVSFAKEMDMKNQTECIPLSA
ncbi:solute carrier family 22 member 6 isoform X3 [Siphateles boraxobius]|uniref:solute carrier family 22 member 6 isoform X3 n=1 Tax=Siphateles boraxobius TaxID=180520 RepID=UPI004062B678